VPLKLGEDGKMPRVWILSDNQSMVDVFYNIALLQNIRKENTHMNIHCFASVTSTNLVGEFPGYGAMWFHPNGIGNILSHAHMKEQG